MLAMKFEDENTHNPQDVPATTRATTPPIAPIEPTPIPVPDAAVDLDFTTPNDERPDKSGNDDFTEKYYCPMKCEGEKTYDHPGNCPVCGMKLEKADTM